MPDDALTMAGLYGKLPAHGDFVGRGFPHANEARIDAAMTAVTVAAREQWGDRFGENWDAAQPWLLAAPGRSAVLIPSVDAAGRRFPLCVAARTADIQQLYDATVDAIANASPADALFDRIGGLEQGEATPPGSPESESSALSPEWFLPDPEQMALPHPDGDISIGWETLA